MKFDEFFENFVKDGLRPIDIYRAAMTPATRLTPATELNAVLS